MIATDTALQKELKVLYGKWPDIRRFLKGLSCPQPDAEDIFQEALVLFCRKKADPDFVLTVDAYYYVRNTCKLLWYNEARRRQKNPQFTLETDVQQIDDDWFASEMKLVYVERVLQTLGKQCQQILQLFYGLGWNMSAIAVQTGLRNDKVVKAQKYRCLQKAKDAVLQSSVSLLS
jgi:RNA polymerase sigma factor (sigma-70 family)